MELGGLRPTNVGVVGATEAIRHPAGGHASCPELTLGIRKHFPTECVHVVHRIRHSGGGSKGCWPPTSPIESRISRPEGEKSRRMIRSSSVLCAGLLLSVLQPQHAA